MVQCRQRGKLYVPRRNHIDPAGSKTEMLRLHCGDPRFDAVRRLYPPAAGKVDDCPFRCGGQSGTILGLPEHCRADRGNGDPCFSLVQQGTCSHTAAGRFVPLLRLPCRRGGDESAADRRNLRHRHPRTLHRHMQYALLSEWISGSGHHHRSPETQFRHRHAFSGHHSRFSPRYHQFQICPQHS